MPKTLTRYASLGFRASTVVALFLGVISYLHIAQLRVARSALLHEHRKLVEVDHLGLAVRDAERGQRGYLLTGKDAYLTSYTDAIANIPGIEQGILQECGPDAAVTAVLPVIQHKLAELQKTITLARNEKDRSAAIALVDTDDGLRLMEDIEQRLAAIRIASRDKRLREIEEADAADARIVWSATGGVLALAGLLTFSACLLSRADRQQRQQEAALTETAERLRLATAIAGVGIFDHDLRTRKVIWDDRFRDLLSIPPDAPQTIDTILAAIHPDDKLLQRRVFERCCDPVTGGIFDTEYRFIGIADRIERRIAMRGRAYFDNGRAVRILGTGSDVTALRQAADVLSRDKAALERLVVERTRDLAESQARVAHAERMQTLGQLAGGIAHDFNNVLQSIQIGGSLIERQISNPPGIRRLVRIIEEAAARGAAITGRLLTFARQGSLSPQPLNASAVLRDLRDILAPTLGSGISIAIQVAETLPMLLADKAQLETVLVNLATNARDAMDGLGALMLCATVETLTDERHLEHTGTRLLAGSYVRIAVTDSGSGMEPAVLARVCQPFFTTKEPGKGTGLGLAMAKGFAEQSLGALEIASRPGHGTTVAVWLPLAPAATLEKVEAQADTPSHAGRCLLVVDDDELVREMTCVSLEDAGYEVVGAGSGAEALHLLGSGRRIDMIISDLTMPGMSGIALIHETQRRLPGLPAILLTGFAGSSIEDAVENTIEGSVSLLRKPIRLADLVTRIEAMLTANTQPAH